MRINFVHALKGNQLKYGKSTLEQNDIQASKDESIKAAKGRLIPGSIQKSLKK
jgi:hypothetical protein